MQSNNQINENPLAEENGKIDKRIVPPRDKPLTKEELAGFVKTKPRLPRPLFGIAIEDRNNQNIKDFQDNNPENNSLVFKVGWKF